MQSKNMQKNETYSNEKITNHNIRKHEQILIFFRNQSTATKTHAIKTMQCKPCKKKTEQMTTWIQQILKKINKLYTCFPNHGFFQQSTAKTAEATGT